MVYPCVCEQMFGYLGIKSLWSEFIHIRSFHSKDLMSFKVNSESLKICFKLTTITFTRILRPV